MDQTLTATQTTVDRQFLEFSTHLKDRGAFSSPDLIKEFAQGAQAVVVVVDNTSAQSLEDARRLCAVLDECALRFFVLNKMDLEDEGVLDFEDVGQLADKTSSFMTGCSVKKNEDVQIIWEAIRRDYLAKLEKEKRGK